jgi:hypothetical protein
MKNTDKLVVPIFSRFKVVGFPNSSVLMSLLFAYCFAFYAQSETYSSISVVSESIIYTGENLIVTLNDGEKIIHIVLNNSIKGNGTLEIRDNDDKIVYSEEIRLWDGSSVVDLEQSLFEKGNYTIKMTTNRGLIESRFTL